jgi:DNA-binding SARP family transcriptional activator
MAVKVRAAVSSQSVGNPSGSPIVRLSLLDGFMLSCQDQLISLPRNAQRVLAFLGLHNRVQLRSHVAATLWTETSDQHAVASLRSTVWRLGRSNHVLVHATVESLRLPDWVEVDYWSATARARGILDGNRNMSSGVLDDGGLTADLLPDWSEDWVLLERERFRQLRLHALEARCQRLASAGLLAQAVEAGHEAVASEPLRESANRCLIEVHLAEGNRNEALRQYQSYCRVLGDELGLAPSPAMEQLVEGLRV